MNLQICLGLPWLLSILVHQKNIVFYDESISVSVRVSKREVDGSHPERGDGVPAVDGAAETETNLQAGRNAAARVRNILCIRAVLIVIKIYLAVNN